MSDQETVVFETNQGIVKIKLKPSLAPKTCENFIKLARGVYFNNDKRAKIKSEINEILGSNIREVKQYVNYES